MSHSELRTQNSERIIPTHVGVILDGNRRWARANGLPDHDGHKHGYVALEKIAEAAFDTGVEFFSAYVFSSENWKRSKEEVNFLMDLMMRKAKKDLKRLIEKNIKVVFIGSRDNVSKSILKTMNDVEQSSKDNTAGTLVFCFDYGGQQEIVEATRAIVDAGIAAGDVTKDLFERYLYQPDIPPVDFMIRTSGEQRLSNFMLWRIAYAELYFSEKLWPDFTKEDFTVALEEFAARKRRFGE